MSKKLEEQCKNLKALESKRLTELRNQLQQKQLETEQFWSELTNTWAAEKITKDSKIDELRTALEVAKEQKLTAEQAWKTTLEAERLEKLEHVNKLLERVKMMENKQNEIKQGMEKKLKDVSYLSIPSTGSLSNLNYLFWMHRQSRDTLLVLRQFI